MGQMGKHLERMQPMGTQTAMVSHLQIPCSLHTPTLAASPPPVQSIPLPPLAA